MFYFACSQFTIQCLISHPPDTQVPQTTSKEQSYMAPLQSSCGHLRVLQSAATKKQCLYKLGKQDAQKLLTKANPPKVSIVGMMFISVFMMTRNLKNGMEYMKIIHRKVSLAPPVKQTFSFTRNPN